jgi:hypothetical protein
MLADLGPLAAAHADDVRALLDARDRWQSVAAAHALWALTGDVAAAVPILLAATDGLADGRYLPVMPVAVNHLAALGPAAAGAVPPLLEAVRTDQRLSSSGAWRAFTQDQEIRAAIARLAVVTGAVPLDEA